MNNKMTIQHVNLSNTMFIGDIHASPNELLTLVNKGRDLGLSKFVSLGDLWDRGYDPNAVTEQIASMLETKDEDMTVIMGNHDWKFIRHFAGQKVSIANEQIETLKLVTPKTIDLFLEIFKEQPVALYDAKLKIFVSHAAGGRPSDVLYNDYSKSKSHEFATFDAYLKSEATKVIDKKYVSNLLYGITNGEVTETGRPVRLLLTDDVNDDLDGWKLIFGHHHYANLFPENGNRNCVCVDYCSGEPGGRLAGLVVYDTPEVKEENLIFA
jgi:hypothetical protein